MDLYKKLTLQKIIDIRWIYKSKKSVMIATISKWGNSQGLRLPKEIMKELELVAGDKV